MNTHTGWNNFPQGFSQNQLMMQNSNQNNYRMAYSPNQQLIPHQDWSNPKQIMHNNVEQNVFNELIMDFTLHMDSNDRDTTAFPNPYKFTVSLGGAGTNTEKVYNNKTNTFETKSYTGAPNPRISRNFRNIKYVTLDRIFFPKYIVFARTEVPPSSGNYVYTGLTEISEKYRYLIVRIKELDNDRLLSTNNNVREDSFIIYKDKDLGGSDAEIWLSCHSKRVYFKSALKNLDKLTIEIVDQNGNQITPTYKIDGVGNEFAIPAAEITNADTNEQYQFSLQMTLGVYENELNTQVNYR